MTTIYNFPDEEASEADLNLTDLRDVTLDQPAVDEFLGYDPVRQEWVNKVVDVQVNIGDLNDLSDVTVAGPQNDEVLAYDGPSQLWVNKPAPAAGASAMDDLTDVNSSAAALDDQLVYDGANWVPQVYTAYKRTTFVPSTITFDRNKIYDTYDLVSDQNFNFSAVGAVDGMMGTVPVNSNGSSVITWGAEFRLLSNHSAAIPTVLPLGINTITLLYDATLGLVLVDITTQNFTADGAQPMTGDLDLNGNNIVGANQITAEYIRRDPFSSPSSGAFAPDFGERSDFDHGSLTGALTINNPINQVTGQEGVIFFDNQSGQTVTLGSNFAIMSGRDPTIPASRIMMPYKVFAPGVIFYTVEFA